MLLSAFIKEIFYCDGQQLLHMGQSTKNKWSSALNRSSMSPLQTPETSTEEGVKKNVTGKEWAPHLGEFTAGVATEIRTIQKL